MFTLPNLLLMLLLMLALRLLSALTRATPSVPPSDDPVPFTPQGNATAQGNHPGGGEQDGGILTRIPAPQLTRTEDRSEPPVEDIEFEFPLAPMDVTYGVGRYQNAIEQTFRIRISSTNGFALRNFAKNIKICCEAIALDAGIPDPNYWGAVPRAPYGSTGQTIVTTEDEAPTAIEIELEVVDAGEAGRQEGEVVVHYVIDPPIGNRETHAYVAQQAKAAWAQLTEVTGEVTVSLSQGTLDQSEATASADGTPSTQVLEFSSPSSRLYDVKVKGNQNGSNYTLRGGWVQG